jgi:hypothetical protein
MRTCPFSTIATKFQCVNGFGAILGQVRSGVDVVMRAIAYCTCVFEVIN